MHKMIDLQKYRSEGSRIFAGRPKGEKVRRLENLSELDRQTGIEVEVRIPLDTFSINSSFFLGLFGDSIRALGESQFRSRFRFTGGRLGRVHDTAIQEALTTESPLSPV